jgi:hypothetical protein
MANQKITTINALPMQPKRKQLPPEYIDQIMRFNIAQRANERGLGIVPSEDNDGITAGSGVYANNFNNGVNELDIQRKEYNDLVNFNKLDPVQQYELVGPMQDAELLEQNKPLEDQTLDMVGLTRALTAANGLGIILQKGRNRALEIAKRRANDIGKALGTEAVGNIAWAGGEDVIDNW